MSDDNTAILEAFNENIDGADNEDTVKMAMIAAGATFKNVTRLFNQFMVDSGRAASKEQKETAVNETLEGVDLSTKEALEAAVTALCEALPTINEKQAGALIRSYGKKNEVEVYKRPAGGGGGGGGGFASVYYSWLVENPTATAEQAQEFIFNSEKTSDNVQKHVQHYQKIRKLVNDVAAAA